MKAKIRLAALVLLSSFILHPSSLFAQGALTPPGAPAPMMKTLAQIEPRIAINATNTPGDANSTFHIASPGSYYLTTNVVGEPSKHGIEIEADNVALDLSGFTLLGVGGSSVQGIAVTGTHTNLIVRNGSLVGWGQHGLSAFNALSGEYTDLQATRNGNYGFATGSGSVLKRCVARSNGLDGFLPGFNNILSECTAVFNSVHGFDLLTGTVIELSTASGNGVDGIHAQSEVAIRNCTARANGDDGISAFRGTVADCLAVLNLGNGILVTNCSVTGCMVDSNTRDGIFSRGPSSVLACKASINGANGIEIGDTTTVSGCVAQGNMTNGIVAGSDCFLTGNLCTDNGPDATVGGAGIRANGTANRIDGNQLNNNRFGLLLPAASSATNNLVVRNSAKGNLTAFNVTAGNIVGPINTGTTVTNHPWANFSH